jgi:hypothetical protein
MDSLIPHPHVENRLLGNPDHVAAIEWARDLMVSRDVVIFDSETTGLSSPVDFVEIAVVGPTGETLFDFLLKPSCRIEPIWSDWRCGDRVSRGNGGKRGGKTESPG